MLNFEFTLEETNAILASLGRMPYESVFQLVDKIRQQAQSQIGNIEQPAETQVENSE